ncbi:VOC family protein [Cellulomonas sp. APG4]|uniref:VOC family protein n=1 Tax=Cellulomonas sp. APG4 TaxID=1538656 RepID=UPI00137AD23F|nr:VOC family protein [Cellulomonas sp. APG4]NCT90311.1 VOC family protein [Cellulomonas sp. APG4]
MEPRVSLITLGVPDLAEARAFYVDGLGWEPALEVPDQVIFFQAGHGLMLSLFGAEQLAADAHGPDVPGSPPAGFTLAHNVGSSAEVDAALARALAAGATPVKEAQPTDWGGYHAYVADPAGVLWEIAFNPSWSVAPDGTPTI